MPKSVTHLQTGFQNESQTLENSAFKDSQPHLRKALCSSILPYISWCWCLNSLRIRMVPKQHILADFHQRTRAICCWHALSSLCFTVANLLSQTLCDWFPVYLSSTKFLPFQPAHTPHTPLCVIPWSHHFFCLISLPRGSDHPSWNAFRCWDRWHSPMSTDECLLTQQTGTPRRRIGHTRVWRWEGEQEDEVEVVLGFFGS